MNQLFRLIILLTVFPLALYLAACSRGPADVAVDSAQNATADTRESVTTEAIEDVIARVGDQEITFSQLNVMLNSSAVVGLSIPAIGTPERDTVRITLLDKIIDANLIYLDALQKGLDQDPQYQRDLGRFTHGLLADLYRYQLQSDVTVTEQEIMDFYNESVVPGTELTDDARVQIEAALSKRKVVENQAKLRTRLREGIDINIFQNNFNPSGDEGRANDVPVAEAGGVTITWGDVKDIMIAAGIAATETDPLASQVDARLRALQIQIDGRLLEQKARAADLEQTPVYQRRLVEYRKTRLINIHRARLASEMEPSAEELEAFFAENSHLITVPEFRKVQMVVLNSEAEAQDIKRRIGAGELTMYEAASRHSISPDAKKDLGDVGWVQKGRALPELEEVVFTLGPGEIGGPVQVGDVWHIMRVTDIREAQRTSLDEEATRKEVRRKYIHNRLDEYTVNLRKNDFPVEVYEDRLIQLAQREADMVTQLAEKAGEQDSVTMQRLEELQKYVTPPQRPE